MTTSGRRDERKHANTVSRGPLTHMHLGSKVLTSSFDDKEILLAQTD